MGFTLSSRSTTRESRAKIFHASLPGRIAGNSTAGETRYQPDLSTADITFSIRVPGVFRVSGRFEQIQGNLNFSERSMATGITFSTKPKNVSARDAWLDSTQYPKIAFSSNRIRIADSGTGRINGKPGLNGHTRDIGFTLQCNPASNAIYTATTRINRRDFGITVLPVTVSRYIDISIRIKTLPGNIRLADVHSRGTRHE